MSRFRRFQSRPLNELAATFVRAYCLSLCFGIFGIVPAVAHEEMGNFIPFETCPYVKEDEQRSDHWWIHKDHIAAVGYISPDYFSPDQSFQPDGRLYEECSFLITTFGTTTFIKGNPKDWEALLELIH